MVLSKVKHPFLSGLLVALAVLLVVVISSPCYAEYDPATNTYRACVKYQRADYSWSDAYTVSGYIIPGDKLNAFANQHGYYNSYKYYVEYFVIPWKEGGYTALELSPLGFDNLIFMTNTTDQRGNTWQIKNSWNFCF